VQQVRRRRSVADPAGSWLATIEIQHAFEIQQDQLKKQCILSCSSVAEATEWVRDIKAAVKLFQRKKAKTLMERKTQQAKEEAEVRVQIQEKQKREQDRLAQINQLNRPSSPRVYVEQRDLARSIGHRVNVAFCGCRMP